MKGYSTLLSIKFSLVLYLGLFLFCVSGGLASLQGRRILSYCEREIQIRKIDRNFIFYFGYIYIYIYIYPFINVWKKVYLESFGTKLVMIQIYLAFPLFSFSIWYFYIFEIISKLSDASNFHHWIIIGNRIFTYFYTYANCISADWYDSPQWGYMLAVGRGS